MQTIVAAMKIVLCLKKVLLSVEESGCSIIRIVETDRKEGEVVEAYCHTDM